MAHADLIAALEIHRDEVLRFLRARTGMNDAEDFASDLYLKLQVLDPAAPIDNPRSYLFAMANRLVLDRLRETQRRARRERTWASEVVSDPACPEKDERPDPEQHLLASDEAECLRRAIEKLPAGSRRVLRLHKFDGLSHLDVAKRLGISSSAVEKHMAVAMRHLRRALEGLR